MDPYSEVDPIVKKWAATANAALFTEFEGAPTRTIHVHGDPPFKCFQISVRPPSDGQVAVKACAIDTNDGTDEDMDEVWVGQVSDLDRMLQEALTVVNRWKGRVRSKNDPPSPW